MDKADLGLFMQANVEETFFVRKDESDDDQLVLFIELTSVNNTPASASEVTNTPVSAPEVTSTPESAPEVTCTPVSAPEVTNTG